MYLYQANQSKLLSYSCDRRSAFSSFRKPLHFFLSRFLPRASQFARRDFPPGAASFTYFPGISGNVIMRCLLLIDGTICAMLCVSINIGFMIQYTSCVLRKGAGKHKTLTRTHTHARSQLMCSRLENFLLGLLEMKTAALWMGKGKCERIQFFNREMCDSRCEFPYIHGISFKAEGVRSQDIIKPDAAKAPSNVYKSTMCAW